ncbi:MAG: hypothetical protein ACR2GK_06640 [Gemmatimonadaceae bacterium]
MTRIRWTLIPVVAVLTLAGCASSSSSPTRVTQSSRDKITSVEIQHTSATSALDLVNKLRPQWLRQAGIASIGSGVRTQVTLVYLDGSRIGGLEALRSIPASGITGMEWIPATRAAIMLPDIGSDAISGVISISTKPLG